MTSSRALLLCGHGSRDAAARAEFAQFVLAIRTHLPGRLVEYGFLELASPTIWEALQNLYERGIRDVAALPIMLMEAGHVQRDLPRIFESFCSLHPDMTIHFGRELGLDAAVIAAATARIEYALSQGQASPGQSVLVVVGRGAAEAELASEVERLTALLRDRLGFAAAVTCYCGIAEPLVAAGLRQAAEYGQPNVLVFPLLLFTGVLARRVHECVVKVRADFPALRFLEADHLNNHPSVIEAFVQRSHMCNMEAIVTKPVAGT